VHGETRDVSAILAALLLVLPVAGCGRGKPLPASRLHEKRGGFSYLAPDDWNRTKLPGLKYQVVSGTPVDGFIPNIFVAEDTHDGRLADFVTGHISAQQEAWPDLEVLARNGFRTDAGVDAPRVITRRTRDGARVVQAHYFFETGDRKIIVTCSAAAEADDAVNEAMEASMRSFRFD